ncbi:hypothetical protein ACWGMA_03315 [Streptomyces asiaticus]
MELEKVRALILGRGLDYQSDQALIDLSSRLTDEVDCPRLRPSRVHR